MADITGTLDITLGDITAVLEGGSPAVGVTGIDSESLLDIYIMRGEDATYTFVYKDDNNVVLPLTGHHAKMEIRKAIGHRIFKTFDETDGLTITIASGLITLTLAHASTKSFDFKEAIYDLWFETGDGKRILVSRGRIRVVDTITEFA